MRKFLIFYNVIFLLAGNILFSNIHYLNEHNHENHGHYECEECINLNNSNNYISDDNEVKFLKNQTFQFAVEYFSAIDLSSANIYLSRAPPLS